MCILCIEWVKGKMSVKEAVSAGKELIRFSNIDENEIEHIIELINRLQIEDNYE